MTPSFKITVSGKDITGDVSKRLVRLEWTDTVTEQADTIAIALDDSGNELAMPQAGVKVELSAGYDGALQTVGSFNADGTELEFGAQQNDTITIKGSSVPFVDKSGKSASDRKTKTWENTTLGSIAQTIAGNLGLSPSVASSLASVQLENEQQTDESDINFVLRLVRREGGYLKFAQGRLVIAEEGAGTSTSGAAINVALRRGDITKGKVSAGGKTEAIRKVKVKFHDFKTGETKEVTADVQKPASAAEFSDVPWLASSESTYTPPTVVANEAQATSTARTVAKRISRSIRKLELTLPGRLDIIAGGKITLPATEFRKGVAGEWLVKDVRHRIEKRGWSMSVECEGA